MIKALHIASFNGNIGDAINHKGFWNSFGQYITKEYCYDYIEMREFYRSWAKRKFDQSFVDLVNSYDFCVIGGGNFFDIAWSESATGTTVDIEPELFKRITVPVIFNGMGVDIANDASQQTIIKFKAFLERCIESRNCIVSVRNDGSKEITEYVCGKEYASNVIEIPDGGFFTSCDSYQHPEIVKDDSLINVAINVACDQKSRRWSNPSFTYGDFCKTFANFCNTLFTENTYRIVFVPHIPSDIEVIADIINGVDDVYRRTRITVAPLVNGTNTPAEYIADLYGKVDLTIGMRYHSNICSIARGVPTIGIMNLEKHKLYKKNRDGRQAN